MTRNVAYDIATSAATYVILLHRMGVKRIAPHPTDIAGVQRG